VARIELAIENQENILVLVIMMSMERPLSQVSSYLKPIILMLPPIFQIATMRDMGFHLKGLTLQMTMACP
jgi:hypothetical protein